mmetsp:Transcript_75478/g.157425  ORF Transcript_75478/g.157425 Transcript_75478/m.157425 type:complete len:346 (+) Transcript_75478:133-1170(+)|eukprot:CAMPEP_0206439254 /NCGR_PEP_ID=MMETSP0324_2-20121206/12100_1 /ASSEMBLY_ACC=CAM_ASM_000836 /TAXON_ID=2866 /ORGANISM="Crypthecodinium cohnii, Strain Seligo" /LENGTH=345 /DNA_ID=CAMNT_0053906837 /DNA_START=71 /DNA_END=1108 /DNA_ORIENTATION=+
MSETAAMAGVQDPAESSTNMMKRSGGLTEATICGVRLEVAHSNLAPARGEQRDGRADEDDDDDGEDAANELGTWLFEEGFSLASATGFARVWPGATVLVRQLADAESSLRQSLTVAQTARPSSCPMVLELGAGCGLVGLAASVAAAADVLLTDTAAVVTGVLAKNLERNAGVAAPASDAASGTTSALPGAVAIAQGFAAAAVLDWTSPIEKQMEGIPSAPDVILAAECIWLSELVPPFAETAAHLLKARQKELLSAGADASVMAELPVLYLSSRERARQTSTTFATVESALAALTERGCGLQTLVARHEQSSGVTADEDDEDEDGPLLVYAVRPNPEPLMTPSCV